MSIFSKYCRYSVVSAGVVLGLLVVQSGCSSLSRDLALPTRKPVDVNASPTPSALGVEVQSDRLALDETECPAISPRQLIDTVSDLLAEEKAGTASCFVQLYPDVAWDLLRNTTADEARSKALQSIAAAHDRQCTRGDATSGWQALLLDRAADPARYRDHDRRRAEFRDKIRNGLPREALALKLTELPDGAPGALLGIDAWHLTGVALLLDERPSEAAAAFTRAIEAARGTHPYLAARLKLLQSDAQRRAGNVAAADATWRDAVQFAGGLISDKIAVADPIFWERAAYLRPVDKSWPSDLKGELDRVCRRNGVDSAPVGRVTTVSATGGLRAISDEQSLWACIGCWRLERGEPQAALVALKRAESMARSDAAKQRLQLAQAKALLALDQQSAGTAILVRLAGASESQLSHAAMATLGTTKLQAGNTVQGFNLLRRAVEEGETVDWSGRADAEADLGLAYLLVGNEHAGLKWLHRAQAQFESAGQHEHLVQSLENELDYLRQAKKKTEAKSIEQRLAELETI